MAEEILASRWEHITELVLVPYTDGRFIVKAGARRLFSKAETGRFPENGEIARAFAEMN